LGCGLLFLQGIEKGKGLFFQKRGRVSSLVHESMHYSYSLSLFLSLFIWLLWLFFHPCGFVILNALCFVYDDHGFLNIKLNMIPAYKNLIRR
jgi:hypothetical protein